ncbi:MAG: T9SS type A sorting domain-containing protein [Ignavibacteriales bacterium]|nr:T9SS type A sorting domain-containing protein [Ignavibacteriales bacterium]
MTINTSVSDYNLFQNFPNPFNPSTVISYQLPIAGKVILKVFDVLAREVATLVNEEKPAGNYEVEFQSALLGLQLSSGVYYYQLQAGDYIETKKMTLLK